MPRRHTQIINVINCLSTVHWTPATGKLAQHAHKHTHKHTHTDTQTHTIDNLIVTDYRHYITKTLHHQRHYRASIYLFKVNNRNTRKRCKICSKLTIKTPEKRRSGVFNAKFCSVSIVDFEQVNVTWVLSSSSAQQTFP